MAFTFKKIMMSLIVILMITFIVIALNPKNSIENMDSTSANSQSISSNAYSAPAPAQSTIGYSNLAQELSKNYVIQALPSGSIVVLKFYNFNSGVREWEKSYILTTGKAVEGDSADADIILSLHSKYLSGLTADNFCSIIQTANANKDLGMETSLSTISLAWKFKSIMQYKSCFGM